jgi:hypothetical protein
MLHSWLGPVPAGGGTYRTGTSVSGGGSGGGGSFWLSIARDVPQTPGLGTCGQGYEGGRANGFTAGKAESQRASTADRLMPALTCTGLHASIGYASMTPWEPIAVSIPSPSLWLCACCLLMLQGQAGEGQGALEATAAWAMGAQGAVGCTSPSQAHRSAMQVREGRM